MIWLFFATHLAIGVIAFRDMIRLQLKAGLEIHPAELTLTGFSAVLWPILWPTVRIVLWDWPEPNQDFIKKLVGWKDTNNG